MCSIIQIFDEKRLLAPLAQVPVLLQELEVYSVLGHPLFCLLNDFSLGKGDFGGEVVGEQYLRLGDVQLLGDSFENGVWVQE